MTIDKRIYNALRAAAIATPFVAGTAHATEGGGSVYPNGVENFAAGAVPPPGLYGMVFAETYHANRVNGDSGNDLHVPGFGLRANVVAGRLAWVPGIPFLGGDLLMHAVLPIVDLKVSVAGQSQHKDGIGDLTLGAAVGYRITPQFHNIVAFDVHLPTGDYSKTNLANIGRNNYAFEPVYILTYLDRSGFNGDVKAGYIFNGSNTATHYHSGNEFHADYDVGWGFGNGWTAGAAGYVYEQTTEDRQNGTSVPNNKARALSLGPSVKFDSPNHWFVTLKWEKEFEVRNRAQGDAIWLKAVFPL